MPQRQSYLEGIANQKHLEAYLAEKKAAEDAVRATLAAVEKFLGKAKKKRR